MLTAQPMRLVSCNVDPGPKLLWWQRNSTSVGKSDCAHANRPIHDHLVTKGSSGKMSIPWDCCDWLLGTESRKWLPRKTTGNKISLWCNRFHPLSARNLHQLLPTSRRINISLATGGYITSNMVDNVSSFSYFNLWPHCTIFKEFVILVSSFRPHKLTGCLFCVLITTV